MAKSAMAGGRVNLPRQPTSFIGRRKEIEEIAALLAEPGCRLLTLLGPGGVGKTRLSIEAAAHVAPGFEHGVYFVDLAPLQSRDFLPGAIADALGFTLRSAQEARLQVADYLSKRKLLLILDNFEALIESGETLSYLLASTDEVKMLVTSRQVLDLAEEWVFPLSGLDLPPVQADDPQTQWESAAIQLFVERARRTNARFDPQAFMDDIARICRLVEGRPLAIELAATWVRTLRPDEIAAEIEANLDFLTSSAHATPKRHHSMQVVFDRSWMLLAQKEQTVFRRLFVFRGGFDRRAAEQICGATLAVLSGLVDKSLLRRGADGRYYIHELSCQYAGEKMAQVPGESEQVFAAHGKYYIDYLASRLPEIAGRNQMEAVREIKVELENLRAAMYWAIEHKEVEDIRRGMECYVQFCDYQGRYLESQALLEASLESLEPLLAGERVQLAGASLLSQMGYNLIRLGRIPEAKASFRRSQALYARSGASPAALFGSTPLDGLAMVAFLGGDYPLARELGEAARAENEDRGDIHNLQISEYVLTDTNLAQGDYPRARIHAMQGLNLTQATGNRWMRAYFFNLLGRIERDEHNPIAARKHYQAGYEIKKEMDDPGGVATALVQLGLLSLELGDLEQARGYFEKSEEINNEINDRGGLVDALYGLARVDMRDGRVPQAYQALRRGLEICLDMHWTPRILALLTGVAEVMLAAGQAERAAALLALVRHDSAASRGARLRAEAVLAGLRDRFEPAALERAMARGQGEHAERTARAVLAEFSPKEAVTIFPAGQAGRRATVESEALVEQLTPREHEVLGLIAEGLSNRQIAGRLVISIGTVKSYTSNIYAKMNVSNRTQAVKRGRELGLVA